ncbi:MAG: DUF2314 domain-containing protein [Myxococcota bacterium]|nr:DUF2314 domain-containing protein [Myxococcota bacterium]
MLAMLLTTAQAAPPVAPEDARGSIAIYCATACGSLSIDGLAVRDRLPILSKTPAVAVEHWGLEFGLPDAEHLQSWGSGDVNGVLEAADVMVVSWSGPTAGAAARVAQVGQAALAAGQWFEDLDSGMVYDSAQFAAAIERYAQPAPDITALTLLEGAQADDGLRLVMHGLGKVGLPDLVMTDIQAGDENGMAIALSTTAQTLYEQGLSRQLSVQADQLASPTVRSTACGIQGTSTLQKARPAPDDIVASLADVRFSGGFSGCAPPAAPSTADAPVAAAAPPPEPATLQEARAAAMAQLTGPLQEAFTVGLPDGAALMVKAPFRGPGRSVEWLWLRVEQWRPDGSLIGVLLSQPGRVESLDKGDEVAVELAAVFDYVLVNADGSREGNTTGRFL